MGVVAVKSTSITNRDASPMVHNGSYIERGRIKEHAATVEIATGDTSTSTYRFFSVPSNARISALVLNSDDCGSQTAAHFGLYDTTANGGAAVSSALFSSAKDIHSGAISSSNILFDNGDIANIEKRVWELLSLASDPRKDYDVVMTLSTTSDAGGTVSLRVHFVD